MLGFSASCWADERASTAAAFARVEDERLFSFKKAHNPAHKKGCAGEGCQPIAVADGLLGGNFLFIG